MGCTNVRDVPAFVKLWVYSLQGIFYEICFTAMFNFILIKPDFKLMGESSIWSVFIYGMGGLLNEYLVYKHMKPRHRALRMLVNLVYTYVWEYSTGAVLCVFGACPWDYTERRWNVHGLITFEYIPAWLVAGILHEEMMKLMQGLCWCSEKAAGEKKQVKTQ